MLLVYYITLQWLYVEITQCSCLMLQKNFHINSKILNLNLQYHWVVMSEDFPLLGHFWQLWPSCLQSPHRTLTLGYLKSISFLILEDLGLPLSCNRVGLGWTIKKLGFG